MGTFRNFFEKSFGVFQAIHLPLGPEILVRQGFEPSRKTFGEGVDTPWFSGYIDKAPEGNALNAPLLRELQENLDNYIA
jgi:hypothetical protein